MELRRFQLQFNVHGSAIAAGSSKGLTVCAPDDGWRYHPKHVEQCPDINKLCKVVCIYIYIYIYIYWNMLTSGLT